MNIVKTAYEKALHYFQTTDGKVWDSTGTSGTVDNSAIKNKGSSLDGSYSYHNHPSGETLSPDDLIGMTERENMLSITASGNNSSIFFIKRGVNSDADSFREYLYTKCEEKCFMGDRFSYYDVKKFDISSLPDELKIPLQQEMSHFCDECIKGGKQYGFNYAFS